MGNETKSSAQTGRHALGARPRTTAATLTAALTLALAVPAPGHAQGARATPARNPATIGAVAPRPPAASDHEPRVRPGRSGTAGAFGPNVGRRPNVGGPGTTVRHLPGPFTRFRAHGRVFYYCLGSFYVRHASGYEQVEAPVGSVVRRLPAGHETLTLGNRTLYYYDGVFYERADRGDRFVVVPAPPGAVVGHLPDDAVETVVRGETYYLARGVYYLTLRRSGEQAYVVVTP